MYKIPEPIINNTFTFTKTPIDLAKEDYIEGINMNLKGSERISKELYRKDYPYIDKIEYIKKVINRSKLKTIDRVIVLKYNKDLSEMDLTTLVRYINICKKGEYYIVFNNRLIYIPKQFRKFSRYYIYDYLKEVFKYYYKERKRRVMKYVIRKNIKKLIRIL